LGTGEVLRDSAKAFLKGKIPFVVRKLEIKLLASQTNNSLDPYLSTTCKYPINCILIGPDMAFRLPSWLSYSEWGRRYNIGYWFWELAKFPKNWRYAVPVVDEIWVNSEFNAIAMRQTHSRVIKIPFAVEFETPHKKYDTAYFNLPKNGFLFLTTFDFNSTINRKNPGGTIGAFLKAFPSRNDKTYLIIKSINGHLHTQELSELQRLAFNDPRIIFIDQHFSTEETRGLLQCADCYISLHRSEGLGLGMAESMYLGKPVIATAYSGNMEYMNRQNSYLIPYTEIPVPKDAYMQFQNQVWAEPNIHEAALALQEIASDKKIRDLLGGNAKEYMLKHHSFNVMSDAIKLRINEIANLPKAHPKRKS
jgi:glycosyltransferase involved in cell wall biosynthesis